MPITIEPKFGSYVYSTNHADPKEPQITTPMRIDVSEGARSDVAKTSDGYLSPRTIALEGTIGISGGSDYDDFREQLDLFMAAHIPGVRPFYRDADRYLNAQVDSITHAGDDQACNWTPYIVRFTCADPFWYSTTLTSDTSWVSPASGASKAYANHGSIKVYPVFTLSVTAGTMDLTLTKTLPAPIETLHLIGAVGAVDVVIDMGEETITVAGDNKMSYLVSGDFFALQPGSNTLFIQFAGITVSLVTVEFRARWL